MGSIPLPALDAQVPTPQSALQEYGRAAALQGQKQEMQQRDLQIQQQKQGLADQQAMTAAMHDWDGKNIEDLPSLILKHNGSAQAVWNTKNQILEQKTKLAALDKDSLANLAAHHDAALGVLKAHEAVPDEQLSQSITDAAHQLATDGHIDPAHAQAVTQMAQTLPPDQLRQHLSIFEKGLMGEKEQVAQANQERETNSKEWKEAGPGLLINTRTGEQKGTLRQPVDQQELTDYLQKNPGKGPSDFAAWKAKLTPNAVIMGNQLGPAGQGSALDQQAELYSKTHELPAGFSRSPGTLAAIVKRAAELYPDADLASNQATFKADSAALKQVQTQFDKMTAFEGTALKNLDLYGQKAKAIPDLGAKFANVPLRMITGQMIGTQAMAELEAARQTASSEVAKVLSSSTGAGVLSDSQKKEAENVINGNYPLAATLGVIQTLKQDMANRHTSYQQDVDAIKGRLGAKPTAPPDQPKDFFSQFGGKPR